MKRELTDRIYNKCFNINTFEKDINKHLKAVIINFGNVDIIVNNDNFKTRRKYVDFTNGKKEAGLNKLQIVFWSIETAHICNDRYINEFDEICYF